MEEEYCEPRNEWEDVKADEEDIGEINEEGDVLLTNGKEVRKHTYASTQTNSRRSAQYCDWRNRIRLLLTPTFRRKILPIIAMIVANYLYILTLEGCIGTEHRCVTKLRRQLNFFFTRGLSSVLIFAIFLNLSIYKKIHKVFGLLVLGNILFLCFIYDTGSTFQNHGGWNRMLFLPMFIIISLAIPLLIQLIKLIKRHPVIIPTLFSIIIVVSIILIRGRIKDSCVNWERGLGGSILDNSEPYCQIIKPEICYFPFMGRMFDFTYLLNTQCTGKDSQEIYNYVPEYVKNIGFPRTEYFTDRERRDNFNLANRSFKFQETILDNLIDLDDKNISDEIKHKTEIKLNFEDRANPRVIIDVKRNEDVANRAKQRSNNRKFGSVAKNTLIIFIDSVSRAHMYRTMPNTVKWLEKYYNNEDTNMESFQFFRFHSTKDFTVANLKPLYYGADADHQFELPPEPIEHLRLIYSEKGYVVGDSHNVCAAEGYEYTQDDWNLRLSRNDHEGVSLVCDPSFTNVNAYYSPFKGQNTVMRRCLYGKDSFDYVFEYGNQFWKEYKDQQKYLNLMFLDAHEATGHGSRYLDVPLANFLQNLDELEDTNILLLSDHGQRLSIVYLPDSPHSDQNLEYLLPLLFWVFPKNALTHSQRTALKENENSLIFNYDLHETLRQIAGNREKSWAKRFNYITYSLFEPIPHNRTGDDVAQNESLCDPIS